MNERVTSKSIIATNFVFKSKCMLIDRAPPGPAERVRRFQDLIFVQQNHQNVLAAGLRPDSLGKLKRSPRPPAAVRDMEGNTL